MLKLKICKVNPLKLKIGEINPLKLKISQTCPSIEVDALLQRKTCCPSVEEVVITPDEGYDGLELVTVQATPLEETTVTPLTTRQIIKPSEEVVGLSSVEVEPVTNDIDENIIPTNIRKGIKILGVNGTLEEKRPNVLQNKTVNPMEEGRSVTYDDNYDGLGTVIINPIKANMITGLTADKIKRGEEILDIVGTYGPTSQIKYATPSQERQIITPDGDIEYLSQVTILPVTSAIDSDIISTNIKKGVEILGVEGTFEGDFNFQKKSVSANAEEDLIVTPDYGYDAIEKLTVKKVTSSIDSDIQPENIKNGIEILGVKGTYAPDPSMEDKYIYPATYKKEVYPDEGYGYFDKVTIAPVTSSIDSNIKATNIREGIEILGVEGTLEPVKGENIEINPSVETQIITPSEGKNAIVSAIVNPVTSEIDSKIINTNIKKGITILGVEGTFEGASTLQTKVVTPTDSIQEISADSGYDALSNVTVEAITTEDIIVDPSMETKTYNRSDGAYINSITVNEVTSDIDANIQPENIKQNMSILGVVGTYKGEQQNYFSTLNSGGYGNDERPELIHNIIAIPDDLVINYGKYMFSMLTNLKAVPKLDYSNLTNCQGMFYFCVNMTDYTGAIGFKKITNSSDMFYRNLYLTNMNLDTWDLSNLTDMSGMFEQCSALKEVKINGKIAPNVTIMASMFENCYALQTVDLTNSEIHVSTNFQRMFYNCNKLVRLDLSSIYSTTASNFGYMFYGCKSLQHINMRNIDLSKGTLKGSVFTSVPTTCEIIVKDDASKSWMTKNFANWSNVKTAAEYDAEQGA